jgi:menaquinone-dependent protoporphyrinogen oxidase
MKPILALYATREGHTRRIAERIAETVRKRGKAAAVVDAAHVPEGFSLNDYSAAVLAASVHGHRHENEMLEFVKRHRGELDRMPTAFVSVSLSEAGAEDAKAPPERRAEAASDVRKMIDSFLTETGWRPTEVRGVAGALLYTKYNFLMRFIMKRIARKAGGDTDTSRDYEYTDWGVVDALVETLAPAA